MNPNWAATQFRKSEAMESRDVTHSNIIHIYSLAIKTATLLASVGSNHFYCYRFTNIGKEVKITPLVLFLL